MASVAVLLLTASGAHAAIAGAPSIATTTVSGTPDLIGVVVTGDGVTSSTGRAEFCFDKQLNTAYALTPSNFFLVGYSSPHRVQPTSLIYDNTAGPLGTGQNTCVIATFSGDAAGAGGTQTRAFTVGTVLFGAVQSAQFIKNQADSHQVGPSDATGPLGRTTGPNILGVSVSIPDNQITFIEDHPLDAAPAIAGNRFFFYDQSGNFVPGIGTATVSGASRNQVTVSFPAGSNLPINAEIGQLDHAVRASDGNAAGGGNTGEPNRLETTAGTNPSTPPLGLTSANPDLIGATVSGPNTVDFTFDKQIAFGSTGCTNTVGQICPAAFQIWGVANQVELTGQTATQVSASNPNIVRVSFVSGLIGAFKINQFVRATVDAATLTDCSENTGGGSLTTPEANFGGTACHNAVTSAGGGVPNIGGSAPLNPSASAPGFTSAPDITSAVRHAASAQVTIQFDQPYIGSAGTLNPADWHLVTSSGALSGAAIAVESTNPDAGTLTLDFTDTGVVSGAIGVQYSGGAWPGITTGDVLGQGAEDPAVPQEVAFAAGSAGLRTAIANPLTLVKRVAHVRKHKHSVHHKTKHHSRTH